MTITLDFKQFFYPNGANPQTSLANAQGAEMLMEYIGLLDRHLEGLNIADVVAPAVEDLIAAFKAYSPQPELQTEHAQEDLRATLGRSGTIKKRLEEGLRDMMHPPSRASPTETISKEGFDAALGEAKAQRNSKLLQNYLVSCGVAANPKHKMKSEEVSECVEAAFLKTTTALVAQNVKLQSSMDALQKQVDDLTKQLEQMQLALTTATTVAVAPVAAVSAQTEPEKPLSYWEGFKRNAQNLHTGVRTGAGKVYNATERFVEEMYPSYTPDEVMSVESMAPAQAEVGADMPH